MVTKATLLHWRVTPDFPNRLRVSAIHFLNPAPLMWSFEHEPDRSRLGQRYELSSDTPAECAAKLAAGAADIGLVPVSALALTPLLSVIPGCTIASQDRVRSIILVVRHPDGIDGVGRVALDSSSRTSATYTRILFARFWQIQPAFVEHAPDLEAMLQNADAALLIGDPALFALEDREARERRSGEKLLYLDLAHEWHNLTGTVWVSAVWAARPDTIAASHIATTQVVADFQHSRDEGLRHIDALTDEWSARIAVPRDTIRTYLTKNIWYVLDEPCLAGLELFYRYGVECGALPLAPKLHFL